MRLKLKNQAIFGDYCGMTDDGLVKFWDEELDKVVLYPRHKVELASYEKGS
tara:strand:+ start:368 stop:520 length:153 start_codon:yes stop_codon:yes gene_type:complete